jgi:hypothetical protein
MMIFPCPILSFLNAMIFLSLYGSLSNNPILKYKSEQKCFVIDTQNSLFIVITFSITFLAAASDLNIS